MSPFLFGDIGGSRAIIQWIVIIFLFMFVVPKLYFYQIFAKIESSVKKLEKISNDGQNIVVGTTSKFGKKKKVIKAKLDHFIDFFMIPPVNLDPYGIMKKLEHLIDNTEGRFRQFSTEIAPKADSEQTMDIYMGLQAAVSIHTITKIVRHYVELVKKFKNLQFAMILQMQLPMIEKIVESELRGLKAFLKEQAIGDGAAALVIASLLEKGGTEIAEDVLAVTENRWGRRVTFLKAKGPGGRLGKLGIAVGRVCKKNKISKIITIDAAQKLEGEKTGIVSEGIGVAIGGMGVQRSKIEEMATSLNIPIEAIAIKMSPFEAISPMPTKVADAVNDARMYLSERISETKKGSNILVVGVGNTCGIPNNNKKLKEIVKDIKRRAKKLEEEEEKKTRGFFKRKSSNTSFVTDFFSMIGNLYRV